MKTLNYLKSESIRFSLALAIFALFASNVSLFSQEVRSVLSTDTVTTFNWGIEFKTAGVQDELSTQYGMYAGALFNHSVMAGMVISFNVTHPSINYGYMGLMVKYIYKPYSVIHLNGQLVLGAGSTRDYENEKTSTFDNFGNVTGAGFYFIEPAVNTEINLGKKTTLTLGLGYRLVNGINPDNQYISSTHVSDKDLSGPTVTAGIEFGLR
jgi:hypothetical protein